MCGRFTLSSPPEILASLFDLEEVPALSPRYNIAPTQPVAVVRLDLEREARELTFLRWGLVPFWAKDPAIGSRLINARAETVAEKPAFREAFRHRRCLVPASGFYEWEKTEGGKQPFFFHAAADAPLAIAGLWERWKAPDGETLETCTLLTTEADDVVQPVHDRMPVVVRPQDYDLWLDPSATGADRLGALLGPGAGVRLVAHPVSTRVNTPANDGPELVAPLAEGVG